VGSRKADGDIVVWKGVQVFAYNGKILFVNLSTGEIEPRELDESLYRQFIGCLGLGIRIIYENTKPGFDPLGPDSMLGFSVGPLTGSGLHGARFAITGKSPMTGGWGDANCGGSFAVYFKNAGYDGVFFTGISEKPVYLFIKNGVAELRDASHLWGKDVYQTEEAIKQELEDSRVRICSIGPPGERLAYCAAVMHDQSAAGRSGLAAVMGSKRLKAFVVQGSNKVPVADPERLAQLRKTFLQGVKNVQHPWGQALRDYGTPIFFDALIPPGSTPIKNFAVQGEEAFPDYALCKADEFMKYRTRRHACLGCPIACKGWLELKDSKYGSISGTIPEYETITMFGSDCLVSDLAAVVKANDLCNQYGLDTIEVGATVAFAIECYENGLIDDKDTGGIELKWGNADALVAVVEKIARREGFGDVLADGVKVAADRIGKGSEKYAMHSGGQALPAHDPRGDVGLGWGYCCDATPGRHTANHVKHSHDCKVAFTLSDRLNFPDLDPLDVDANAGINAVCSAVDRVITSAGLCFFAMWTEQLPLIEAIAAVTGWDFTLEECIKTGRRIDALRQAFNIREGVDTTEWKMPERVAAVPTDGPMKGKKLQFDRMKLKGYEAMGWDPKTGKPLASTIDELGLRELVGDL
jgi:aldehyde:ferredoxin oxidoreductase